MICFVDASKDAMCAAVYMRYESPSGNISVGLLTSKTKVSPAKQETIPRLELCSSLLGCRLVSKVVSAISVGSCALKEVSGKKDLCFSAEYFLMDSRIALGTLNKGNLSNDFTGNCVAEVRGKTENAIFAWVRSEDNIADLGTRGAKPAMVSEGSDWHRGPPWLQEPIYKWPIEICKFDELPTVHIVQPEEDVIRIEKFSDIGRLHKTTALCLKFIKSKGNGKGKLDADWTKIRVSPGEYKAGEMYWVKKVSKSVLNLYESGKLQSLRPLKLWDEQGKFLKVVTSGRLGQLLKIGYDVEQLTILDPEHPYTKLVLKEYHEKDHGGDDRAVWRSREKFWIPQARRIVKRIRSQCYRCKLLAKRNAGQLMAPLPSQRVLPTPAWTYTSVDLFAPLEHVDMVRKRMKEKCWGVIFTCMVCRAVHIDLTQAYHIDALLQALRRFMALRGTPKRFLSDQGTQLVACSKEVSVMLELTDWSIIEGWCSRRSIE